MADPAPQTRSIRLGIWVMLAMSIIFVGGALGITWMLSKKETPSPPQVPGERILNAPAPDNGIKEFSPGDSPQAPTGVPATSPDRPK